MKRNISLALALFCSILLFNLSCSTEKDRYFNSENSAQSRSATALKSREPFKNNDFTGINTKVLIGKPLFFYSTLLKKNKSLNLVVAYENNEGFVDGYIDYALDSSGRVKHESIYDVQSLKSRTVNSDDNQLAIFETLSSKGYKLNHIISKELEIANYSKSLLKNPPSKSKIFTTKEKLLSSSDQLVSTSYLTVNSSSRQCGAYFKGLYILDYRVGNNCPSDEYHSIVDRIDKHLENNIRDYLNQNGNHSFSIHYGIDGFYINGGELGGLTDYGQTDNLLKQWFNSFSVSMSCINEFRYVRLIGFGAHCVDPNNPGNDTGGGNSDPSPLVGEEGTGENPDVPDPDLPSNCASWAYTPVSAGDYQVAGVTNLRFVYISEYIGTDGKMHIDYYRGTFTRPLYFEFPRIRSNGDFISPEMAAKLTAQIKDEAERILDSQVNASPTPKTTLESDQMIDRFFNILKYQMQQYGGRVTKVNNYGNGIIIKPYSKTVIPCY